MNGDGYIQANPGDWSGDGNPGGVKDYSEVLQENHYYPFGMSMEGQWRMPELALQANRYQFNGIERHGDMGVDLDLAAFRSYDAAMARWLQVDPLADNAKLISWSSYHYTYNNPIIFTDPDGRLPIPLVTGFIGAAGGLIYGLTSSKNWKQTIALTAGGFFTGITLGFGGAGIAALGEIETLGGAGASYIMIGSGVVGGLAGNAVEQGVRIALEESPSFNSEEFAISGAFGMSEVVLGPTGDAAGNAVKNSIKEGLKGAILQSSRVQFRRIQKEIACQIRQQAGTGIITKKESMQAAKALVQAAQEQRSATLKGIIRFSENGVNVSVSAMQTSAIEEIKSKELEDGNN